MCCYDRFARWLGRPVNPLEEFRALGIEFVSIHEGVETSTANGRQIFGSSGARKTMDVAAGRRSVRPALHGGIFRNGSEFRPELPREHSYRRGKLRKPDFAVASVVALALARCCLRASASSSLPLRLWRPVSPTSAASVQVTFYNSPRPSLVRAL